MSKLLLLLLVVISLISLSIVLCDDEVTIASVPSMIVQGRRFPERTYNINPNTRPDQLDDLMDKVENIIAGCTFNNIDYSGMMTSSDIIGNSNEQPTPFFTYYIKLCGPLSTITGCSTQASACQCPYQNPIGSCDSVGAYTGDPGQWGALPAGQTGVMLTYSNGKIGCQNASPRQLQITALCNPGGDNLSTDGPVTQPDNTVCNYFATVQLQAACGTAPPPGCAPNCPPPPCTSNCGSFDVSVSVAISGGWVFCIIIFVCTPVYFLIGCAINYRKGVPTWKERTPNLAFWSAIPGLCKDGCKYTWTKLRGLCGGATVRAAGTYETL
jgi:hypothetical protein